MTTGALIKLTVHRNTRQKRERRYVWQGAQEKVRRMPKDIDGFVMVYFKSDGEMMKAIASWRLRDPKDTDRLPDLARNEIQRTIMRETKAVEWEGEPA